MLLPLPLSPTSAVIAPRRSEKLTSSTACTLLRRRSSPVEAGKRFVEVADLEDGLVHHASSTRWHAT